MKALLIIGESFKQNRPFLEYLTRTITENGGYIENTRFIEKSDKDLPLILEELISKNDEIIIAANSNSFNIACKIVSTVTEDSMILKGDMLIPSKTAIYEKNTILIEYENKFINIILVEETKKIPQILISSKKEIKNFNIFDIDEESCRILLTPLAENYDIKIKTSQIVDGWTSVLAESNKFGKISNFISSAWSLFPGKIVTKPDLIEFLLNRLMQEKKTITVAESCTGGLISSMITKYAGVSSVFKGSLVTYSNTLKESWLGVSAETLQTLGAVSENCVREMLEGAISVSGADLAIAVSGVAGPTGESATKPIGTVYVGVGSKDGKSMVSRLNLDGDREYIQYQTALHAFKTLFLLEKEFFLKKP